MQIRKLSAIIIGTALAVVLSGTKTAHTQGNPNCSAGGDDTCSVETFTSASTGGKGDNWSSPNNFEFTQLEGNSLQVEGPSTLGANLGNGFFFPCDSTMVEFPTPPEPQYVTFVLKGKNPDTLINFVAFDGGGDIVDETVKRNRGTGEEGAEVVHLGTGKKRIQFVVMHHVDPECNFNCSEPVISEIRACKKKFP